MEFDSLFATAERYLKTARASNAMPDELVYGMLCRAGEKYLAAALSAAGFEIVPARLGGLARLFLMTVRERRWVFPEPVLNKYLGSLHAMLRHTTGSESLPRLFEFAMLSRWFARRTAEHCKVMSCRELMYTTKLAS